MLVLSRKVAEDIVIGSNIRLKIIKVDGNKVRIGITAPPDVVVDRQEVHDRKQDCDLPVATSIVRPAVLV